MVLNDFIKFLKSVDCEPKNISDIIADDVSRYFEPKDSKNTKKSCSYQVAESNGFGFGWVHNFRTGETHVFKPTQKKEWTEEEKRNFKHEREEFEKKRAHDEFLKHEQAAKKANDIYSKAIPCVDHAYADRKFLIKEKLKVFENALCIPIYENGKIVNLQRIDEDGDKPFLWQGKVKGCYGFITDKGLPRDTLIICEGYATGDALFQCLNIPVIIAFTANNIQAVAKSISGKYPESKIIIAADNDQWAQVRGKPYNTGLVEANKAASAIGGAFVVYPDVPEDDEKKRTDWNDIFLTDGIESVKIAFEGVLNQLSYRNPDLIKPQATDPLNFSHDYIPDFDYIPEHMDLSDVGRYNSYIDGEKTEHTDLYQIDWRSKVIVNSKGVPEKRSVLNLEIYLEHFEKLKGLFVYDCFCHKILIFRRPPWDKKDDFRVREYVENDTNKLRTYLESIGLTPNKNDIFDAVKTVALDNMINPAQDYFSKLQWDGKNRLDKFLEYYFCANPDKTQPEDNPEYLSVIGKKWMVAAVKRVFEAGCKFDNMLVIEGDQGIGKSRALRMLCTFGKDEERAYFTDSIRFSEISKPDTVQKMWGCLVVEIAELSGLSKSDVNSVKNWITNQEDMARLPYDRLVQKFKRQCVFAGTTNNYDYLTDTTGNRRFWCFKSHDIDFDELERDRDQLWAEAYELYKSNYPLYLTPDEYKMAEEAQSKRLYSDPWENEVLEVCEKLLRMQENVKGFRIEHVLTALGILTKDQKGSDAARVRGIIQKLGYKSVVTTIKGKSARLYRKDGGFDV